MYDLFDRIQAAFFEASDPGRVMVIDSPRAGERQVLNGDDPDEEVSSLRVRSNVGVRQVAAKDGDFGVKGEVWCS